MDLPGSWIPSYKEFGGLTQETSHADEEGGCNARKTPLGDGWDNSPQLGHRGTQRGIRHPFPYRVLKSSWRTRSDSTGSRQHLSRERTGAEKRALTGYPSAL